MLIATSDNKHEQRACVFLSSVTKTPLNCQETLERPPRVWYLKCGKTVWPRPDPAGGADSSPREFPADGERLVTHSQEPRPRYRPLGLEPRPFGLIPVIVATFTI